MASVYAFWNRARDGEVFADGAAHSILPDLSALITDRRTHRLVVAGDLNIMYGYGELGLTYWAQRYQTLFEPSCSGNRDHSDQSACDATMSE